MAKKRAAKKIQPAKKATGAKKTKGGKKVQPADKAQAAKKIKGYPWTIGDGMSYEFPDGSGLNLWAAGVRKISKWTYLWASFERDRLPKVWYRVSRAGKEPADDWELMKPAEKVLEERGETMDEEGGAEFGTTLDLPRGRYVLAVKFRLGSDDYELNDCKFSVK